MDGSSLTIRLTSSVSPPWIGEVVGVGVVVAAGADSAAIVVCLCLVK